MLYYLHELAYALGTPLRVAAGIGRVTLNNPYNPISHTLPGRFMAAQAEMTERMTKRYGKPRFKLSEAVVDGEKMYVDDVIVVRKPFCNLLHFKRTTKRNDPKVLIVAPLSGHYATLLRGTVEALLPHHDVYITDWIDARYVPLAKGGFGLEGYISYVMEFLDFVGEGVHVIGVCQPAVPVLAAVALKASRGDVVQPRTMTLMGGPVDARVFETAPTKLAKENPIEWFQYNAIHMIPPMYPGAFRQVYPGFLQLTGFMTMNMERHIESHIELFQYLVKGDGEHADKQKQFYDEYLSVMDLPAEFYLETIKAVFQEFSLPRGKMRWKGIPVDPADIRKTALMVVEGELDDISGIGQTKASIDLCKNIPAADKVYHLQKQTGHYGIFNGHKWRQEIMPRMRDFMRAHDKSGLSPAPKFDPSKVIVKPADKADKNTITNAS